MDRQHDQATGDTTSQAAYAPAGEDQGVGATFTVGEVASAFEVEGGRIRRAMSGEFSLGPDATVTSRQAQHLAEVVLGDLPLERQQAALMRLGAYTPRSDYTDATVEEKAPGEQSDRIRSSEEVPDLGAPSDE